MKLGSLGRWPLAESMLRRTMTALRPGPVILMYHRVFEPRNDPLRLCVRPRRFAAQLAFLRRRVPILPLSILLDTLAGRCAPRRAVVVTFDDGYADALYAAKPLLERFEVPVTTFITAGAVGSDREFWWDELERILLDSRRLPDRLSTTLDRKAHTWEFDGAPLPGRFPKWDVLQETAPTVRHLAYRTLFQELRPKPEAERQRTLETLAQWARQPRLAREEYRALTHAEVRRLCEGNLIEVGAHSVTHPVLSRLDASEQRREIAESKSLLEAVVGAPIRSFAYPYGTREDFSAETVALVRETGFSCACANYPRNVRPGVSPYELPRIAVGDWEAARFARALRNWISV